MTSIPNMDDPLDLDAAWKAAKAYDTATDAEFVGKDFTKAYAHLAHAAARHLYAALREHDARVAAAKEQGRCEAIQALRGLVEFGELPDECLWAIDKYAPDRIPFTGDGINEATDVARGVIAAAADHLSARFADKEGYKSAIERALVALGDAAEMRERYIKAETRARRLERLETAVRDWREQVIGDDDPTEILSCPEWVLFATIEGIPPVEVRGEHGPEIQVNAGGAAQIAGLIADGIEKQGRGR